MSERWRLIAGWTPEPWLALLLALAALIAVIDAWQGLRRPALPLARGQRLALFGLRLLGIAALAVVVGEATIAIETVAPTGPRV
ncbi:MAG: hypothetical protein KC420_20305, partial [Myxococcales bacterium]|nr:hypothetical protein [Myxococcales bacterium]